MSDAMYPPAPPRRSRRPSWRLFAAAGVALAVIAALVHHHAAGRVSTDDARIDGHVALIAASVGGRVLAVRVQDNAVVEAGTLLAEIDPAPFEMAVDRARAELQRAQAAAAAAQASLPLTTASSASTVGTAEAERRVAASALDASRSEIDQAQRRLEAARARKVEADAEAAKAERDVERLATLLAKDEISKAEHDVTVTALAAARASADAASAEVLEAQSGVATARSRSGQAASSLQRADAVREAAGSAPQEILRATALSDQAEAGVQLARTALRRAELDLADTKLVAPIAGMIGRRTAEPGQVVQPGQPLMAIVGLDDLWVTANFKETDVARIRAGQPARVKVDALGRALDGHVEGIGPAALAEYSLLPAENSSGNFVKVVQRVPVRIALDERPEGGVPLRVGMNVEPTVLVR